MTMAKIFYIIFMFIIGTVALYSQSSDQSTLKEAAISGIVYIKPNPDDFEIGAGFLINSEGYILTNYHVIKDAEAISKIYIEFSDGEFTSPESIILQDQTLDIAILKIPASKVGSRTMLPLNTSEGVVGEDVISFGHPLGFKFNMTKGVISNMTVENEPQRFLFDAPTNPGNSGGPLLNKLGLVLGMVEGRYDSKSAGIDVQNLNTGIKVSYLKAVLDRLGIKYSSTALLVDKEMLERQRMQLGQDSLKVAQASQELAMRETQRKQDSISAHLEKQKRDLDSAKTVQDEMLQMIIKERNDRKRFEDSLRNSNMPKHWTLKFSLNYGYDAGAFKDIEDNDGLKKGGSFYDFDLMFGYRANITKNDDKGTILALFLNFGSLNKNAAAVHYFRQGLINKMDPLFDNRYKSPTDNSIFIEAEAGIVVAEGLRISAGVGTIDVWETFFDYYSFTAGFVFPLGAVNLDFLLSSMFGQDFRNPTLRGKIGIGYRMNFK